MVEFFTSFPARVIRGAEYVIDHPVVAVLAVIGFTFLAGFVALNVASWRRKSR